MGIDVNPLISEEGRALQAKVSQMKQGGAGPDQIQVELNRAVMQGLVPISVAFAMQKQLQNPMQASSGPPPSKTVVQQMADELSSRQQGVASLPAGNVGNEQSYAKGGIVAFSDGGFNPSAGYDALRAVAEGADDLPSASQLGLQGSEAAAYEAAPVAQKTSFVKKVMPEWFTKKVPFTGNTSLLEKTKSLGSKAGWRTAGLGAARTAAGLYAPLAATTAVGDALNPIPTEDMRKYYHGKGLTFIDPEGGSLWGDVGVRTLGELQRVGTLGFTGPQHSEVPPTPTAKPATEKSEPTVDYNPYEGKADSLMGGPGGGGIASLGVGSAFEPALAAARQRAKESPDTTLDAETAIAQKRYADAGIGQGVADYTKYLSGREKDLAGEGKRNKWMAAAKGFFDMAEKASEPGATFLGAAASGASKGTEEYQRLSDKLDDARDKLAASKLAASQADEAVKKGTLDEGSRLYQLRHAEHNAAQDRVTQLELDKAKAKLELDMHSLTAQAQIEVARIGAAARAAGVGNRQMIIFQLAAADALKKGDKKKYEQVLADMADWTQASSGIVQSQILRNQVLPGMTGMPGMPPAASDAGWGEMRTVK